MEAKTYRVKSISEAIEKIRDELGPDASVLHTRRLRNSLWSWLNGDRYEVVASNEVEVPDRFQQWLGESIDNTQELVGSELTEEDLSNKVGQHSEYSSSENAVLFQSFPCDPSTELGSDENSKTKNPPNPNSFVSRDDESFEEFLGIGHPTDSKQDDSASSVYEPYQANELTSFEKSLSFRNTDDRLDIGYQVDNWSVQASNRSGSSVHRHGWDQLYAWLLSCGADTGAADLLCSDLKRLYALSRQESSSLIQCPAWDELVSLLGSQLRRGGTIQNRVGRCQRVAFVGPTGVGKTTTLAKLAGEYKLRRGLNVGLITVDTYRVAAVDQLKAYADIMKTPLEVVSNEDEMSAALESMDPMDLVLIDTIGRSPSDSSRIQQLQSILRVADLDQLFLTLSAGSSNSSLERSYAGYQPLTATIQSSLILTKVDECSSLAGVYPFLKDCPLTWSYWTNGQDVPDDLGVTKDNVALWFMDQIPQSKQN